MLWCMLGGDMKTKVTLSIEKDVWFAFREACVKQEERESVVERLLQAWLKNKSQKAKTNP
jgi:hypothetical protein